MLDLFTIFTKGGIVLWFFRGTNTLLTQPVNSLISREFLQQQQATNDALSFKFRQDNLNDLIFLAAHQKILQLTYVDDLLDSIQEAFLNYISEFTKAGKRLESVEYDTFGEVFQRHLAHAEAQQRARLTKKPEMRTFDQSKKFSKSSAGQKPKEPEKETMKDEGPIASAIPISEPDVEVDLSEQDVARKRMEKKFGTAGRGGPRGKGRRGGGPGATSPSATKKKEPSKPSKANRTWGGTHKDQPSLDFSTDKPVDDEELADPTQKGSMVGALQDLDIEQSEEEFEEDDFEPDEEQGATAQEKKKGGESGGGVMGFFRSLVSNKVITRESLEKVMDKMREHLVSKNVAADVAQKLCDSVASKLEGRTIGTFSSVSSTVRSTLEESLVQILSAGQQRDTLRDVTEARRRGRPYVITFCGVNGVGKSTNLAKICFWLLENGFRVLVAGCDTFRAGAVEQLRVHVRRLHSLHPPSGDSSPSNVLLYEKGYGKDAAGIASEAIAYARENRFDVVLVDTAGRMQDNEPLMRALAKLIKVNSPDLVLFVGEALVGNEAVDQLSKFNSSLADYGDGRLQLIDGVLLTKFDAIDDKVGAAVSMAYTSGKPIVFVGTGQTYGDLKNLNANAVVKALLRG